MDPAFTFLMAKFRKMKLRTPFEERNFDSLVTTTTFPISPNGIFGQAQNVKRKDPLKKTLFQRSK